MGIKSEADELDKDDDSDICDDDPNDKDDDCPIVYNLGGNSKMALNKGVSIEVSLHAHEIIITDFSVNTICLPTSKEALAQMKTSRPITHQEMTFDISLAQNRPRTTISSCDISFNKNASSN